VDARRTAQRNVGRKTEKFGIRSAGVATHEMRHMTDNSESAESGIEEFWRSPYRMEPDTTFRFRVPIDQLRSRITASKDVFVLAHFGVPRIDAGAWRLHFTGMLNAPFSMTLDDVKAFPRQEIESFIKCAGFPANHRIATRNASNAIWGGARLIDVVESVGLLPEASYLWFSAPDHGAYQDWSAERYTKDLPISRVKIGDVLLAYEMNHEPLTPEHGFPLRIFVPGYYGTNSVKWLCHIEAADRRAPGIFTNQLYNDPVVGEEDAPTPRTAPVWGVAPEALIVDPPTGAKLTAAPFAVSGWCWGENPIDRVELSCDGGQTWFAVKPEPRRQTSWQFFSFDVSTGVLGKIKLQVRATDTVGVTQPAADARNSIHEVNITVGY
jgi:sulfane dehydrogenase subunit SoxC